MKPNSNHTTYNNSKCHSIVLSIFRAPLVCTEDVKKAVWRELIQVDYSHASEMGHCSPIAK